MASSERVAKLAQACGEAGIDAFLAWSPYSMTYLAGFGESAHERFLTLAVRSNGEMRLICPALSATQASRAGVQDIRTWRDGEDPLVLFRELADDWNLRSAIIAVDNDLPAHMLLRMQEALPAALFKQGGETIGALMRVKEPAELDLLQKAADIADAAFPVGLKAVRAGATELEVERALMEEMRRLGGIPTFCIIATGPNGAEPHHESDETPIREGDVIVMDFGCSVGGYQSDITRTVCCGKASDEAKKAYRLVWEAHMAGRKAIQPGVACQETDRAARKVIADGGQGDYFIHRLGHGIGMQGHEEPNMVEGNTLPLAPGHCFSIEPGVYYPGRFGIRIENIVTCTEDGHRSFNEDPAPELLEV